MSIEQTKDQLTRLLADEGNKVLAVSGKWGTGKTHMWREVKKASSDDQVKNSLYVSLFGLTSMAQVKLKLVQSAMATEKNTKRLSGVADALRGAKNLLVSLHPGFSALEEAAMLAVPIVLKDRVVVLDDIERKHDSLSIDEVLGFIDEFTQLHGARFVLVLNSDQLVDAKVWSTLREKVVDQEIRLDTSPSEAFAIAEQITRTRYPVQIEKAVSACRVTNIRVIRKVIKVVNQVLGERDQLPDAVLARVIPSTVLLSAINYRGIENGPDFDYVLSAGVPERIFSLPDDQAGNVDKPASWKLLLTELGIRTSDEFELLVVEYLQSGLFNVSDVGRVIDRYIAEHEALQARNEVNLFIEQLVWDHRTSDAELLRQADQLRSKVRFLDAFFVSALAAEVAVLPAGAQLAEEIVEEWLLFLPEDFTVDPDDQIFYRRPLHPRIKDVLKDRAEQIRDSTTVFDACMHIAQHSGWGTRQEMVLKSASIDDFQRAIETLSIPDLQRFTRKMFELTVDRETYKEHFGSAMAFFVEATRRIIGGDPDSRLSRLMKSLFKSYKIEDLLDHQLLTDSDPEI